MKTNLILNKLGGGEFIFPIFQLYCEKIQVFDIGYWINSFTSGKLCPKYELCV